VEVGVANAVDAFVTGCKSDGIWDSIKSSCILAGARTLAGALVPLRGTAPTNNNFAEADYNRETGLVGDGSTKYLDSNRNNNADPQDDNHNAIYHSANVGVGGIQLTAGNSATGSNAILRSTGTFQVRSRTSAGTNSALGATLGFKGISRSASADYNYRVGSTDYTASSVSQTPFNGNVFLFSDGNAAYGSDRIAFYSIGEALDLADLDSRVTRLIAEQQLGLRSGLFASGYNMEAIDWLLRVYANGGTVSESTAAAVNTFCNAIDAAGIRDRFYRLNLFAGTGLNAALVPLYRGPTYGGTTYGNTVDQSLGSPSFGAADYNETGASGGLVGNGSSKYLNTGFNANAAGLTTDSVHMSAVWPTYSHPAAGNWMVLSITNAAVNTRFWLNVSANSNPTTAVLAPLGQAVPFMEYQIAATNGATVPGGLWTASRTSTSSLSLYEGATSRDSDTSIIGSAALPSTDMTAFVRYNGSSFFGYSAIRLRGYSIGLGMTAQQVSDYNAAMTSLQTALGRT